MFSLISEETLRKRKWSIGESKNVKNIKISKLKNIIAIGGSANWPAKVWPAKKFGELINILLKKAE